MRHAVIVVPCFNEFKRLPVDAFKDCWWRAEKNQFLFVDDGSTDATSELLSTLNAFDPQCFRVLQLPQNVGKAEAVRQGFLEALKTQPHSVGYWDADLAAPLELLPEFVKVLDQETAIEIVIGARVILLGHQVNRRLLRHYLGRIFATVASLASGLRVYDSACGAKLFRITPNTISLFTSPFMCQWIFDVELLTRYVYSEPASKYKTCQKIWELPLRKWSEIPGSKLKWFDFPVAIIDLIRIFVRYRCRIAGNLPTADSETVVPVSDVNRTEESIT